MLFRFESVSKEFGGQPLLRELTLQVNAGDRIGVIGPNGSGKTTLLNLIEGTLEADGGRIARSRDLKMSRILQLPDFDSRHSIREEALKVFAELRQLEERLRRAETRISDLGSEIPPQLAAEYEQLRGILELQGVYDYPARTEAVLLGVGFQLSQLDQPCSQLSGGQANRLLVAKALLRPASLLLLDEPTNHLDLNGILWLINFLGQSKQSFLVVSHDRHFLDGVTHATWELEGGRVYHYSGSYSIARRQREERRLHERKLYERQQEWKLKTEDYIRRNIAGQKTKQAQARRKRLEKAEWLEPPRDLSSSLSLRVIESHRGGSISFELKDAAIGFPGKPLLQGINMVARRGDRIALLGANGSGKTTLFRVIAGDLFPTAGEIRFGQNMTLGYLPQNPPFPDLELTVLGSLRELDPLVSDLKLRSHAAAYGFRGEEVEKKIAQLSGGERSRLAMARLFYHPRNLLLLDEPTNHLDLDSREALEAALDNFGGTQILISHDLFFVRRVANRFWKVEGSRLCELKSLEEVIEPAMDADLSLPAAARPVLPPPSSSGEAPGGGLSKNERFRRERELAEVEERISRLEERQRQTLQRLETESDYTVLLELGQTHEELAGALQELYLRWEAVASELAVE